jgi:lipopolysaccharide/colanic/teichoic acid biosynthesis glycosyltransferase
MSNNGKVFFVQDRPGKDEKIFHLFKFKTMNDIRDENGKLLPDSERLMPFGKFLRKTSIDEIPQLLNVLKGDLSMVGPRPLLKGYLPLYNDFQKRRHEVRPGITGWAQINGRNTLTWPEKFDYDIYYIDNLSFCFDIKILWLTFIKVLKREGINSSIKSTMKPFRGNFF